MAATFFSYVSGPYFLYNRLTDPKQVLMINYSVKCRNNHQFDGWFKDSATFDKQAKAKQIECPSCGDTKVSKAPMAPRISKKSSASRQADESRANEVAQELAEAVGKIREHVEANCDYVGTEFAEEARKIHYGEADERGIYGEATVEEAKDLDDEGIDVLPLPKVRKTS